MHEPGPHASSAKSTTTAYPVGQPPETEGVYDQTGNDLGTRGKVSARPPRPSELPVIERAIQSLQDVPRFVKMQGADPLLGKARRVLGSRGGTREQEGLTDAELSQYVIGDQNLLWLECERVGILARKTTVLAVPQCPTARPACFGTLPTWPPRGGSDVVAASSTGQECVGVREITCCRAGADAESGHVATHSHAAGQIPGAMGGAGGGLTIFLNTSEASNEYLLLVVDQASKFLFA